MYKTDFIYARESCTEIPSPDVFGSIEHLILNVNESLIGTKS